MSGFYDRFEIENEIYKWKQELEKLDCRDLEEIEKIENKIGELKLILIEEHCE